MKKAKLNKVLALHKKQLFRLSRWWDKFGTVVLALWTGKAEVFTCD